MLASACEVVADFDPNKLDSDRTIVPAPLPSLDGAVAKVPEASVEQDGALIKPPVADAQAPQPVDAGDTLDASREDAATAVAGDAASADSGNDAASTGDISFADASLN